MWPIGGPPGGIVANNIKYRPPPARREGGRREGEGYCRGSEETYGSKEAAAAAAIVDTWSVVKLNGASAAPSSLFRPGR